MRYQLHHFECISHSICKQSLAPAAATACTGAKSQENIWQFMRQNWLSNRIFKSFDDIVHHIARRDWAVVGQSI